MAYRPLHACPYAGCGVACKGQYCDKHTPIMAERRAQYERKRKAAYDRTRPNSHDRLYGADWRRHRAAFLIQNPFCVECRKKGLLTPATVVDHIKPHKGDRILFWDKKNWQSLCKTHHDQKTARHDSKFTRNR